MGVFLVEEPLALCQGWRLGGEGFGSVKSEELSCGKEGHLRMLKEFLWVVGWSSVQVGLVSFSFSFCRVLLLPFLWANWFCCLRRHTKVAWHGKQKRQKRKSMDEVGMTCYVDYDYSKCESLHSHLFRLPQLHLPH